MKNKTRTKTALIISVVISIFVAALLLYYKVIYSPYQQRSEMNTVINLLNIIKLEVSEAIITQQPYSFDRQAYQEQQVMNYLDSLDVDVKSFVISAHVLHGDIDATIRYLPQNVQDRLRWRCEISGRTGSFQSAECIWVP